ncbi:MAG: aspartate aminotransferase family protein [Bdellovibrionales bacterium]|nr:aspartate aminotransferase family protein [Bdellovibrionales bacterium]
MSRVPFPSQAKPEAEIFSAMDAMRTGDADWKHAKTWSLVYHVSDEHTEFLKKAYGKFFTENLLNPLAFKSLKKMETEVVQMVADLLHAGPEAVGTINSGGTESLLLAAKSARDRARKTRPWIRNPEVLAVQTTHVALEKACATLGIKFRSVGTRDDYRADVDQLRRAVNRNTILIAASAPQYPQGVIDPIEEIAAIALDKNIPFHVDACIGGFFLPFMKDADRRLPAWDFRVKGVTSISADLHKFGYTAKGASALIYRDMSYLKHQFFVSALWSGGFFGSPSMPGTRPGGAISAAWATLQKFGRQGYEEMVQKTMEVAERFKKGIEAIPELQVLGNPDMSLIAYATRDPSSINIYAIADQLEKKGWLIDRQQSPACIHATVTLNHAQAIDAYMADLRQAVETVKKNPQLAKEGQAGMYGLAAKIPVKGLVNMEILKVMEGLYSGKDKIEFSGNELEGSESSEKPPAPSGLGRLIQKFKGMIG